MHEIDEKTNVISKNILDCAFYIHTKLGPGLLESVYEDCMHYFLLKKGLHIEKQKIVPVQVDDLVITTGLRLDLLVEDKVVVELKAVEKLLPIHEAQLHTYLKLSSRPLGLLINFNVRSLKDGIKRIAMTKAQTNFA